MLGHVIKDEDGVKRAVEMGGRDSVCITIDLVVAKIELYPHGQACDGAYVLRLSKGGPPETGFEVVMTPEQMLELSVSLQALAKSTPRREMVTPARAAPG
ncbi:MAG: hypothetical protein RIS45_390 [Planctomycetota bacterium]